MLCSASEHWSREDIYLHFSGYYQCQGLTVVTEIQCKPSPTPHFCVILHPYLLTAVLDFDT